MKNSTLMLMPNQERLLLYCKVSIVWRVNCKVLVLIDIVFNNTMEEPTWSISA